MIKWKLNEVMARKHVSGKDLAAVLKTHPNTVYRLRRSEQMPNIDGDILNKLCEALECSPDDLIDYLPDKKGFMTQELLFGEQRSFQAGLTSSRVIALAASAAVDAAMSAMAPVIRQAAVSAVESIVIEQMGHLPTSKQF